MTLSSEAGRPQLPLYAFMIGLPEDGEPSIEILDSDFAIIKDINIYPSPKPAIVEEGGLRIENLFEKDEAIYEVAEFYPDKVAELGFAGLMRNQKVAQLKIYPFRFNPVSGELRHYKRILIKVSFNNPVADDKHLLMKGMTDGTQGKDKAVKNGYDIMLQEMLVNYYQLRR